MKEFIYHLEKKYKIQSLNDWERISSHQIQESGGPTAYSLKSLLQITYPDKDFSSFNSCIKNKKSSQRWLSIVLRELFPDVEVIEDGLTPSGIELDVWIPKYSLGVEYHGIQHYLDSPHYGPLELYQFRDQQKIKECKRNNIKLLVVPFWWDNQKD